MKFVTGLLAAVLLLAGMGASHAVVRIAEDRGGRIGTYVDKYQDLRSSGETVIIDGLCASACTIVLGAVPHDKICVTSHANLGFHAAWDFGANGRASPIPKPPRCCIRCIRRRCGAGSPQRGGLTPHMIFLRGKQLMSMYKPCYLDAQASAPRTSSSRRDRDSRPHDVIAPDPCRACPAARLALSEHDRQANGGNAVCRCLLRQMVAHGSANFHAAGDARPATRLRAGSRRRLSWRRGSRRRSPARRAGAVVPLRDGGLLRDDRLRHRRLLLIREFKEFHDGSDHPPAGHRRSLRRKPGGRAGADAVGARRIEKRGGAGRDRRAVPADRPGRPDRDRKEPAGPPDADLLRLHPLPRRLPDLAVRDFRGAAGDGQGCRSRQRLFHLGRSRARHRRGDEGLSVELRSASEGSDRQSRRRSRR